MRVLITTILLIQLAFYYQSVNGSVDVDSNVIELMNQIDTHGSRLLNGNDIEKVDEIVKEIFKVIDREAEDRGAKDRGAKDRGAKDRATVKLNVDDETSLDKTKVTWTLEWREDKDEKDLEGKGQDLEGKGQDLEGKGQDLEGKGQDLKGSGFYTPFAANPSRCGWKFAVDVVDKKIKRKEHLMHELMHEYLSPSSAAERFAEALYSQMPSDADDGKESKELKIKTDEKDGKELKVHVEYNESKRKWIRQAGWEKKLRSQLFDLVESEDVLEALAYAEKFAEAVSKKVLEKEIEELSQRLAKERC